MLVKLQDREIKKIAQQLLTQTELVAAACHTLGGGNIIVLGTAEQTLTQRTLRQ